jgi:glycosyltransferase involved in cell wall biosynthesis
MITASEAEPVAVSVIIPAFNSAGTIGAQLAALRAQQYHEPWEVIVVDNGSSDDTCEAVRAYQGTMANLKLVAADGVRTAGYARNAGVAAARAERLLFCDADDVVAPGWLSALAQALREHDFIVGRVEVKQLNAGVEEDHGNNGLHDRLLNFLPYAIGCNFAVTRRAFERVGGFAPEYKKCGDVEFSWRLQLAGFRLEEAPAAVVHYRYRRGAWAICKTAFYFSQAHAALYKRYARYGARRSRAQEVLYRYRCVLGGLRHIWRWSLRRRAEWAFDVGVIVGRTCGSLRYRTFYP